MTAFPRPAFAHLSLPQKWNRDEGSVSARRLLRKFQAALGEAAQADKDETARAVLRHAVEIYSGDPPVGVDMPWVEPVRADLHRRARDAHLRLAELEEHAGRPVAAIDVL